MEEEKEPQESTPEEEKPEPTADEYKWEWSEKDLKDLPDDFAVEIGGRKWTKRDQIEAIRGYERTSDYTKKTQELAEQRRQFEEQQKTFASSISELVAARDYVNSLFGKEEALRVVLSTPALHSDLDPQWVATEKKRLGLEVSETPTQLPPNVLTKEEYEFQKEQDRQEEYFKQKVSQLREKYGKDATDEEWRGKVKQVMTMIGYLVPGPDGQPRGWAPNIGWLDSQGLPDYDRAFGAIFPVTEEQIRAKIAAEAKQIKEGEPPLTGPSGGAQRGISQATDDPEEEVILRQMKLIGRRS